MTSSDARTSEARLAYIAASAPDHIDAQGEALNVLRDVISFDVGVFSTVDPATILWTGCVLCGTGRDADREAFMFENEYRQDDLHKVSELVRGPERARRLSAVPLSVREQSPRYQAIRGLGAGDELRCVLMDGGNCWGSIELYRWVDAGPFTDAEVRTAALLSGTLARLVRLGLLRLAASLPEVVEEPPGIVVLDGNGGIEAMSLAGQRRIEEISVGDALPPSIRALALRLGSEDGHATSMIVPRTSGGWLRLHATRLLSASGHKTSIVLEPVKPAVLPTTIAQVYGFTPRESEVIRLMARGLSAKEIGAELRISPFTVNDHAKAVFQKAGVQSRQQLIATLFFDHCLPLREVGALPGPYGWFLDSSGATNRRGKAPAETDNPPTEASSGSLLRSWKPTR
ncbi:MAG: LuxR C-terminal-related transcriptional regulator [Dehalococcoidia bacterium]